MMQLTGYKLHQLAIELRATADAIDQMANEATDPDKPFNYSDDSLTVKLAKEFLL